MSIERIARMEAQLDDMRSDVADIRRALLGNGRPGLVSEVAVLKDRQRSSAKQAAAIASALGGILGTAASIIHELLTK